MGTYAHHSNGDSQSMLIKANKMGAIIAFSKTSFKLELLYSNSSHILFIGDVHSPCIWQTTSLTISCWRWKRVLTFPSSFFSPRILQQLKRQERAFIHVVSYFYMYATTTNVRISIVILQIYIKSLLGQVPILNPSPWLLQTWSINCCTYTCQSSWVNPSQDNGNHAPLLVHSFWLSEYRERISLCPKQSRRPCLYLHCPNNCSQNLVCHISLLCLIVLHPLCVCAPPPSYRICCWNVK